MEHWSHIFRSAKHIVNTASTIDEAIAKAVAEARQYPAIFDEPDYWTQVEQHDFRASFEIVSNWAAEALSHLKCTRPWQMLILDLGDCPETFFAYIPGAHGKLSEEKLLELFRDTLIGADEFECCFSEHTDDPFAEFFGNRKELADRSVRELTDPVLDWTAGPDYHGTNGYFLWLIFGGFALFESIRSTGLRDRLSDEGKRLHIVIGFEELFSHFATVE